MLPVWTFRRSLKRVTRQKCLRPISTSDDEPISLYRNGKETGKTPPDDDDVLRRVSCGPVLEIYEGIDCLDRMMNSKTVHNWEMRVRSVMSDDENWVLVAFDRAEWIRHQTWTTL